MKIQIRGSKVEITDSMKKYAREKLEKLNKYIKDESEVKANIVVKIRNISQKIEITIPLKSFILRVEEEGEDFYSTIDTSVDKLERQIRKNKTKLQTKLQKEKTREFAFDNFEELMDEKQKIVKRKKIDLKPMSEEEAIIQMELSSHQFYVFKSTETSRVTVVYKRKEEGYGIIET